MSEENVEIVRAWIDAFNRGDLEDIVANLAPDFEYVPTGMVLDLEAVYQGPEGLRRFLERFWADFDEARAEIDEFIEVADMVLVPQTLRGRGKQSGVETSWRYFQLWTVRDGRLVRGQGFTRRDKALEAAGLSE